MTAALIAALISVESAGFDGAIGDMGRAYGPLQIHQLVVTDVNRFAHTHYQHRQAFDRQTAIQIANLYVDHYATPEILRRPVTDMDRARIWNGGPDGWKRHATKVYWARVSEVLKKK